MTDCIKSDELIAYLTGKISPAQKSQITLHLEQCDNCAVTITYLSAFMPSVPTEVAYLKRDAS